MNLHCGHGILGPAGHLSEECHYFKGQLLITDRRMNVLSINLVSYKYL